MGRRDAWNSRLRDRKQLSFSWQKAKEVPKQHSWDAPEQNLPGKRGKEKGNALFHPGSILDPITLM